MLNSTMKYVAIFMTGAFIYGICEIFARGFTHITMGILGGLVMLMIHYLNTMRRDGMNFWAQAVVITIFITSVEFVAGVILNLYLRMNIWDYSDIPFNYRGQICAPFVLIWFVLAVIGIYFDEFLRSRIFGEQPYYEFNAPLSNQNESHV